MCIRDTPCPLWLLQPARTLRRDPVYHQCPIQCIIDHRVAPRPTGRFDHACLHHFLYYLGHDSPLCRRRNGCFIGRAPAVRRLTKFICPKSSSPCKIASWYRR
ncbi:hypothetical protein T07_532 [Trichinella nelsoni]|uniref:Uncharacterized protein n=1 Tax=Trichinella nelsoni TaxID=6336 RepID=A0A0V0SFT0_9BILA|nr:hypothetical protein T07_532 [Trichinella nelsoni]